MGKLSRNSIDATAIVTTDRRSDFRLPYGDINRDIARILPAKGEALLSHNTIFKARRMTIATIRQETRACWMCGAPADSSEHIFKARGLRRIFDQDGYLSDDLPFYFFEDGHERIRGPKSKRMKYPRLICTVCNGDRSGDFDRAYDRLSDWFTTHQANYDMTAMDFREVFGAGYIGSINAVRRYCAKALGCKILASGYVLPANFPNPISSVDTSLLQLSICRIQPLRHVENYTPNMMERVLGKSSLYVNISRSHLEVTGEKKVLDAVWWENIGHFQITYWFNIEVNHKLGEPIDDTTTV